MKTKLVILRASTFIGTDRVPTHFCWCKHMLTHTHTHTLKLDRPKQLMQAERREGIAPREEAGSCLRIASNLVVIAAGELRLCTDRPKEAVLAREDVVEVSSESQGTCSSQEAEAEASQGGGDMRRRRINASATASSCPACSLPGKCTFRKFRNTHPPVNPDIENSDMTLPNGLANWGHKDLCGKTLTTSQEAKDELRSLKDRVEKLEKGGSSCFSSAASDTTSRSRTDPRSGQSATNNHLHEGQKSRQQLSGVELGNTIVIGGFPPQRRKALFE